MWRWVHVHTDGRKDWSISKLGGLNEVVHWLIINTGETMTLIQAYVTHPLSERHWVFNTASESNRLSLILRQFASTSFSQCVSICIRNYWWNSERFWPSNITRWIIDVLGSVHSFGSEMDMAFGSFICSCSHEKGWGGKYTVGCDKELFLVTGPLCPVHVQATLQLTVRISVQINVKNLSEFLTRFYSAVTISSTFILFWR